MPNLDRKTIISAGAVKRKLATSATSANAIILFVEITDFQKTMNVHLTTKD